MYMLFHLEFLLSQLKVYLPAHVLQNVGWLVGSINKHGLVISDAVCWHVLYHKSKCVFT